MNKDRNQKQLSQKDFERLSNVLYSLAFEDEFRSTKVKKSELDEFLKEVAEGGMESPDEFIREGIERTFTPALVSIIKEKLRRFAEKYKKQGKGEAALLILSMLHGGAELHEIPFFIAIFARAAAKRPLSEKNRVWKLLYGFLPRRIKEGDSDLLEKPETDKEVEEDYETRKSGILIPKKKKKEKKKGKSSKIILPGEE